MFKKFKSIVSQIGTKVKAKYKSFTESFEENVTFNKKTGKVEFKVKGFKGLVTRTLYRRAVYKARQYQRAENALIKKHQHKITTSVDVGGKKRKNTLVLGEFTTQKLPRYSDVSKVKIRYKADYWETRDKIYRDNFMKAIEQAGIINNVDLSYLVDEVKGMRISEFKAMMYTAGNQFVIFHNWYEGSIEQIDYMIEELERMIKKYSGSGRFRKPNWEMSEVEKGSRSLSEKYPEIRVRDYQHNRFAFRTYRKRFTSRSSLRRAAEAMSQLKGKFTNAKKGKK